MAFSKSFHAGNSSNPGQISYVGLRRFVVVQCAEAETTDYDDWRHCEDEVIWWQEAECAKDEDSYFGFPCARIDECRDAALNNIFGAFMSTAVCF